MSSQNTALQDRASDAMSSVAIEQTRAIAEIESMMIVARRFPRDEKQALDKILLACTRPSLAEASQYLYNRGGTDITGPTIRLAEMLAQNWGYIDYGWRELSNSNGRSTVQAFAWDMQSITRNQKVFDVPHWRHTKAGGYALKDPRDVYELVANNAARRLRSCILGIIPGDVVESALNQCEVTLKTNVEINDDSIASMIAAMAKVHVTQAMIEKKIQRPVGVITPIQFLDLKKIYQSLKDGMAKRDDFFEIPPDDPEASEVVTQGAGKAAAAAAAAGTQPKADKPAGDAAAKATEKSKGTPPVLTAAIVRDKMNKAAAKFDKDMLYIEASNIQFVTGGAEGEQTELNNLYGKLLKDIEEKGQ